MRSRGAGRARPGQAIALYGRTYLDVEVRVNPSRLAEGKGKMTADMALVHGGLACNAARALAGRFSAGSIRLVTVASWASWPRLRRDIPEGVVLDLILDERIEPSLPPVSVIINPADACCIIRDGTEADADHWRIDRVPSGALSACLHVMGRLPSGFVSDALDHCRSRNARFAWCGGDALPRAIEAECDIVCVNQAEAARLLGQPNGVPSEMARALAARAQRPGAIRVVTGGSRGPTAVAAIEGDRLRYIEASPPLVPPNRITRLKGAGDVFAARFLAEAWFDPEGRLRRRPALAYALRAAQESTARFITSPYGDNIASMVEDRHRTLEITS